MFYITPPRWNEYHLSIALYKTSEDKFRAGLDLPCGHARFTK